MVRLSRVEDGRVFVFGIDREDVMVGDVMLSVSSRGGGEMAERDNVATMASQLQQQPQPPPLPLSDRPCSSATNSSTYTPRGAYLPKLDSTPDEFPVGMRVLVVDDDPICLMVVERMLHRCSYRVTTCEKATDALSLLREDINKFDLVLSDVYMPEMDGFKLLELVRLEMDLPVIMMSGNGETSAVMKGITLGACDFLLKPVYIEALRNIWQHAARKKRKDIKVVCQTKSGVDQENDDPSTRQDGKNGEEENEVQRQGQSQLPAHERSSAPPVVLIDRVNQVGMVATRVGADGVLKHEANLTTSGFMKVVAFIMRLIESIWHFFGTLASGSNYLENEYQINVELCNHLQWKIQSSRRLIRIFERECQGVEVRDYQARIVHQELKRAMKRGEDLLCQCKCEGTKSWLYSALTLMNIREDFLDIEFDLRWWSALFKVQCLKDSELKLEHGLSAFYDKLYNGSKDSLDAAAKDAKSLESKLRDEMNKHAKGTEQHLLAVYLSTRFKHAQGKCDIPAEDILDKYFQEAVKTEKYLGGGANGKVFSATWLSTHKWAMKLLSTVNESRPEATFLQSCNHPNIIRYMWSWQQELEQDSDMRVTHILMEGMPMDLDKLIARKRKLNRNGPPFKFSVAINLMLQIAKAVRYLHGNKVYIDGQRSKITHRDLKPKNILVEEDDEGNLKVKLADLGISKVYQGTQTFTPQTKCGTSVYTAPEVWLREGDRDEYKFPPKADVWSFAITCSEILTGESPFSKFYRSDLHVKIKEEGIRPRLPDDLDEEIRELFKDCWHLDPRERPDFEKICKKLYLIRYNHLMRVLHV